MDKGLYPKYRVYKTSSGDPKGKEIKSCFVLRPLKDELAREAIRYYAKHTGNKILSRELFEWVDEYEGNACIDPSRGFCDIVNSPVCCGLCNIRDICREIGNMKCFLIEDEVVRDIEDCKNHYDD